MSQHPPAGRALAARARAAVTALLGTRCVRAVRLHKGEAHAVFRVDAAAGRFVFKAFADGARGPLLAARLRRAVALERALAAAGIPRAPLVGLSAGDALFPGGYLVTRHVDGRDARTAVAAGALSIERYAERLGAALRQVHQLDPVALGLDAAAGAVRAYFEAWRTFLARGVRAASPELREGLARAFTGFARGLDRHARALRALPPVAVHGDPRPENVLLARAGVTLIDWDNTHVAPWCFDLAHVLADDLVHARWGRPSAARRRALRTGFLRGYGSGARDEPASASETLLVTGLGLHGALYWAARGGRARARAITRRLARLAR